MRILYALEEGVSEVQTEHPIWGSTFMREVPKAVNRFSDEFGFDLEYSINQPKTIDGDSEKATMVAFTVKRPLWFDKGRRYCLYVLYDGKGLCGFIGRICDGNMVTLRELGYITDLSKGGYINLYNWLVNLIKASCDKL
ncbi:MAG: hypothetical protein OHK0032_03600 [Thermodesulfovibrionales bacterium]